MIRNGLLFSGITILVSAIFSVVWTFVDESRGGHFLDFIEQSALFNALIYISTYFTLLFVRQKAHDKVGFLFLGFVLIKMIIAGSFVILKLCDIENGLSAILYFFPTYFTLLMIEVGFITRLLKDE